MPRHFNNNKPNSVIFVLATPHYLISLLPMLMCMKYQSSLCHRRSETVVHRRRRPILHSQFTPSSVGFAIIVMIQSCRAMCRKERLSNRLTCALESGWLLLAPKKRIKLWSFLLFPSPDFEIFAKIKVPTLEFFLVSEANICTLCTMCKELAVTVERQAAAAAVIDRRGV